MYEEETQTPQIAPWIQNMTPDQVRAEIDKYAVRNGTLSEDEYTSRQSGVRGWREEDQAEADGDLLWNRCSTPKKNMHPLAHAYLAKHEPPSLVDLIRDSGRRHASGITNQMSIASIVARTNGTTLVDLQRALSNVGNGLVLQRSPDLLRAVLAITAPRQCQNYRPHATATVDVDIEAPTTYEYAPYQELVARFSGNTLQLGMTVARHRISQQLLESDDVNAIAAMMAATVANMSQNEAVAVSALLTANANLADGRALFNTTDGNIVAGGAKDAATLGLAFEALADVEMNSKPCGASPRTLLVPSGDLLAASVLVDTVADRIGLQVLGVPSDWLGSASWYVFADPSSYPTILRGTLGTDGQSVTWSGGQNRQEEGIAAVILEAHHNVGFAPVGRAGAVKIEVA